MLKIIFIILIWVNFAHAENTVVSTTRLENTFDENNQPIQYVEQNIKLETSSVATLPRLGYIHRHSYGVSVNFDFNSNSSNSSITNFLQFYTSQVGSVNISILRVTYVYVGGYDFKGNTLHDFDFDVRKDIPFSELFHGYLSGGYYHEQRVLTIGTTQYAINNRDIFYKVGLYYTRSNYKIGFHIKNAYDTTFNLKMSTIAIYSVFNF